LSLLDDAGICKRKLLFTHEAVLPHEVGMGTSSFTHPHNQRTELQKREEEAIVSTNISGSSPTVEQKDILVHHIKEEIDSTLAHDINQLHIKDDSVAISNPCDAEGLKVATPVSLDDKGTNDVLAFDIPVSNSTDIPVSHSPLATAAVGNYNYCTSVFIDVVEWLSPLIVGQLNGKVQVSM